ncbi:hypothetical protein K438DRAFT_1783089 [Mycena galopus ATCC 62051]|nr:hypothetical protein K438DRAFT_1783089 [Mycena galopus ATCC 62051]
MWWEGIFRRRTGLIPAKRGHMALGICGPRLRELYTGKGGEKVPVVLSRRGGGRPKAKIVTLTPAEIQREKAKQEARIAHLQERLAEEQRSLRDVPDPYDDNDMLDAAYEDSVLRGRAAANISHAGEDINKDPANASQTLLEQLRAHHNKLFPCARDHRKQTNRTQIRVNAFAAQMEAMVDQYMQWSLAMAEEGFGRLYEQPKDAVVQDTHRIYVVDLFSVSYAEVGIVQGDRNLAAAYICHGRLPATTQLTNVTITIRSLEVFRIMQLRCPRLGLKPFVHALCDLHSIPPRSYLTVQFSIAFNVYLAIHAEVDKRYGFAITAHLLRVLGEVGTGYDIGCKFGKMVQMHPALSSLAADNNFKSLVGAFHGHAHNRTYQLKNLSTTDAYQGLALLLAAKYRRALGIKDTLPLLHETMAILSVESWSVFEMWLEKEKVYLESLTKEPVQETLQMEYYQKLVNLADHEKWLDELRSLGLPFIMSDGTSSYSMAAADTRRIETQRHHTLEVFSKTLATVQDLEVRLGITRCWEPDDEEWVAAARMVINRRYQQALDELEGLIVARMFELSKAHMSDTGQFPVKKTANNDYLSPGLSVP